MLGVREKLPRLRAGQAVLELIDRQRRIECERREQRTHFHGVEEMQLSECLGITRRESRKRSAGLVEVLVDDDASAVAERRTLLDWRLDIGESEAIMPKTWLSSVVADPTPRDSVSCRTMTTEMARVSTRP